MLKAKDKEKIITKYKVHKTDTGSADVQVAILTEEIKQLTGHLKDHPKDNSSRRGLLKMVVQRKRLLNFLEESNKRKYNALVKKLGLKS